MAELVALETVSSATNSSLVDRICEQVEGSGARLERFADATGAKIELLVSCGPETGASRAGLVLSGHMDTVPAGEPEWTSDPFVAADAGDRWVGRGTCDMKGFLALAVTAFKEATRKELSAPLVLLFTSDEELGSLGAQRFVDAFVRQAKPAELPRACVVGEPTSLRVVHRHKGHYRLRLEISGQAAHSGFPHRGDNAIERAGLALQALTTLRSNWEADTDRRDAALETPFQTLNLGTIAGGRAVNVVPDRCVVEIGIRPLPGVAAKDLRSEVEAALASALLDGTWRLAEVNDSPSLLTPPESAIHTELCRLVGQDSAIGTSFASDAGVFQQLGLESVLFGPGSIEVAHKPNEFLPKDEFHRAGEVLDSLVDTFCVS